MSNSKLIKYELKNILGNWYTPFFGIGFPIVFSLILGNTVFNKIPAEFKKEAVTSMFLGMSLVIPMAVLLIGYTATYSQELEKNIHIRLELFGISKQKVFRIRLLVQYIFITFSVILYTVIDYIFLDIYLPTIKGVIIVLISLYVISIIMFFLGHGIASILGAFGPAYGISMFLYFFFMFISGLMGPRIQEFPKVIKLISHTLPMSYYGNDFVKVWRGENYNFAPFIQSLIFLFAISILVMFWGLNSRKRKL